MTLAEATAPHLLVVDDDSNVRALLEQLLATQGYQVRFAGDGREALALVATAAPDLILLDLDMPHVSGYEVCRQVKNDPATPCISVIILASQGSTVVKLRASCR